MSRFRTYGQRDDPHVSSVDRAFQRMNSRGRKNLLQEGDVAYSYNGRMDTDGAWQPRKGLQAISSALTGAEEALTLPFYLYADVTGNSLSRSGDVVTVGFASAHGLVDFTLVNVGGITGLTPDPNGKRVIRVNSATEIEFTVPGLSGTVGGTAVVGGAALEEGIVSRVVGACIFSDPDSLADEYCIVATNEQAVAVKLSDGSETEIAYPEGVTLPAECELLQAFDRVYLFRAGATPLLWDGDLSGTPAFTKVPSGTYTQPDELRGVATISTAGEVSVAASAHELSDGQTVVIVDPGTANYLRVGTSYVVQVVDVNTFRFFADVGTGGSGDTMVFRKRVSVGGGFTHMPAPPWAVYFQRRLIAPYHYEVGSGADTYTDRGVRDELIASDLFDGDTWDPVFNQFRITAGIADFTVALQPFVEDGLLVLNRNSLHLLRGLSGSLQDVTTRELTSEVGCLARKSVQMVGSQILFLSDNGLYAVSFADEYNLRGVQMPLSEPIQDQFDTINREYASGAVSLYHDNRYYLAVPTGDSRVNDTVFVYNFLNAGWESIDQVQTAEWAILDMLVGRAGVYNRPYAINTRGGVHEMESDSRADGNDAVAVSVDVPLLVIRRLELRVAEGQERIDDDFVIVVNGVKVVDPQRNVGNYDWETEVWVYEGTIERGSTILVQVFDGWASAYRTVEWTMTVTWSDGFTEVIAGGVDSGLQDTHPSIPTYIDLGVSLSDYLSVLGPHGTITEETHYYDNGSFIAEHPAVGAQTFAYPGAYVVTRQYALNSPERARYTRFSAQLEGGDAGESDAQFTALLQDPDATVDLRTLEQYNNGANLPAGEDATVRGAIRRRGYGLQMQVAAIQGRPKLRGMLVDGHLTGRNNRSIS